MDLGLSTPAAPDTRVAPMQAAAPVEGWDVPKILGILNIVFGVICGVCQGAGIVGALGFLALIKSVGGNSEAETILMVASGLMVVAILLLLAQLIPGSSEENFRNVGQTTGMIVRMICPVILLVFITKPEVKRVLS